MSGAGEKQTLFERLELKYWVDERQAETIRRAIDPFVVPDRHNAVLGGHGYPIYSLYFDTPALDFHHAKLRGAADRYKLRARAYDEDGPVHLEVKRKVVDVIRKTRVAVPRQSWVDAIAGFGEPVDSDNPVACRRLSSFAHLLAQAGAEPQLLVRYEREAYESHVDGYARVTFDRAIEVSVEPFADLRLGGRDWISIDRDPEGRPFSPTLLELKCETRMPVWLMELVHRFQLRRTGFSKYGAGVMASALGVPSMTFESFLGASFGGLDV